ncbi:hypothetical protein [Metaclostridioides mangenotii]|uniref:hypothetical protein n=1 Tax=Metaclostridioides mangenotii TaxID=1540 RepID=UPI0004867979|nr:hypothetical protein [Clostridioides mangenotii]
MFRQIPCEYDHVHDYKRTPVTETERRGRDKVIIYYDVYLCKSCGCTFRIVTDVNVKKDHYKWI